MNALVEQIRQDAAKLSVALRSFLPVPARAASWCPPALPAVLLQTALQHSVVQQWQTDTLAELRGRWLLIEVRDWGWRLWITRNQTGVSVTAIPQAQDVRIAGTAESFSRLLNGQTDPDTLFFRRQLSIDGDTALGLAIKNQLDQFEFSRLHEQQKKILAFFGDAFARGN